MSGCVGKNSPSHDSGTREIREQIAGEWPANEQLLHTHILIFLVIHGDCIKYDLLHFGYPMFTGKHFSTVQVPQNNSFYQHQRKTSQRTDSVIINMIFVTVRKY